MTVKMFLYINKTSLNKAIAQHFKVPKIKLPNVRTYQSNIAPEGFLVYAFYNQTKDLIGVNERLWHLLTPYEQYSTIVHEFVHAYQRAYSLCEFDSSDVEYGARKQEAHCISHTKSILDELGMQEVLSVLSILE